MTDDNTNDTDADADIQTATATTYLSPQSTSELADTDEYSQYMAIRLDGEEYADAESIGFIADHDARVVRINLIEYGPGGTPTDTICIATMNEVAINSFIGQGITAIDDIDLGSLRAASKRAASWMTDPETEMTVMHSDGDGIMLYPAHDCDRIGLGMIQFADAGAKRGPIVAEFSPPTLETVINCAIDAREDLDRGRGQSKIRPGDTLQGQAEAEPELGDDPDE